MEWRRGSKRCRAGDLLSECLALLTYGSRGSQYKATRPSHAPTQSGAFLWRYRGELHLLTPPGMWVSESSTLSPPGNESEHT